MFNSQAVQVGQTVYVSGCLGLDKDTMKLVSGGAANEAKKAIENLEAVLVAADSSLSNGKLNVIVIFVLSMIIKYC